MLITCVGSQDIWFEAVGNSLCISIYKKPTIRGTAALLTTRKQLKDVSVLKRTIHTSFVALSYRLQLSDTQKANIQLCPFHCCPKLKHNVRACVRWLCVFSVKCHHSLTQKLESAQIA